MVENILLEADSQLFDYLCQRSVTSTAYAWPMLQTVLLINIQNCIVLVILERNVQEFEF